MPINQNQNDIELLHTHPENLILSLNGLIEIIIYQYINSGKFTYQEFSEVKQQINIELLEKIDRIKKQYQGKSLLRTYFTVIIRNSCNEILRNKKKPAYISYDDVPMIEDFNGGINSLIVEEEILRFRKIVDLYFKQKNKLILCLKLRFKMVFSINDFLRYNENITQLEFDKFTNDINPYGSCTDSKIFIVLTPIFNKFEKRENTPDSDRKWVSDKINEIIDILNGSPPTSKYDKETFQILFEKCYYEEHKMKSGIIFLNA